MAIAATTMSQDDNSKDDHDQHDHDMVMPGFRFHPTEEELIEFYLRRKVEGKRFNVELITFLDLYRYDPWELPALAAIGEKEWFFYVPRDRKYRNGDRPNRVTTSGYWKATGADRMIRSENFRSIGLKKTLVFYSGKAPKGIRTSWIMNEYRLPHHETERLQKAEISLCRVYKRAGVEDHPSLPRSLPTKASSSRTTQSDKKQHCATNQTSIVRFQAFVGHSRLLSRLFHSSPKQTMERAIHVALVPFVAFGHLIPFYELSIALAKAGVHVSFISTRNNIQRLPQLPSHLSSLITFVPLSWSTVGSNLLAEGVEATVDIPPEDGKHLLAAFDLLKHPFKQFVIEQSPDWIISDFVCYWTVDVAKECHIPLVIFSAFSAATNVFYGPPEYLSGNAQRRLRSSPEDLTSPPWWVSFRSSVHYRRYEAIGAIAGFYTAHGSGISFAERFARTLDGCRAVAIRGCREFEGEYFDLFGKIMGNKRVIPTGVLLPEKPNKTPIAAAHNGEWSKIFEWLDEQKPKSVVFVGFGSECKLSRDQVYEIASGLESSELPFLWALRKPSWASNDLDTMPPDFGRRTSGIGKVCIGWAPQIDILAHPSVGGSLFHAGWGSVIETLQFGHCMVVLPLIHDQPLSARLLVEKGLAIEVERGEDGSFCGNNIALCLRKAMASKEGDEMRTRVEKAAAIFRDEKLHHQYVDEFVEYLKNGK